MQTTEISTDKKAAETNQAQPALVTINAKEYGLTDETAAGIAAQFRPMLAKMEELEKEYNEVVALPINDPVTAIKAKAVRLKYVKVRTGTATIHKDQKEFYRKGGLYVDGWKNAQVFASSGKEERLAKIENFLADQEAARIAGLQTERADILSAYVEDAAMYKLGEMLPEVWNAFCAAKKSDFELLEKAKADAAAAAIRAQGIKDLHELRQRQLLPDWAYVSDDFKPLNLGVMTDDEWMGVKLATSTNKAAAEAKQEQIREDNLALKEENERLAAQVKADAEALAKARSATEAGIAAARESFLETPIFLPSTFGGDPARTWAPRPPAPASSDKVAVLNWIETFGHDVAPNAAPAIVEDIERKFASFIMWAKSSANTL